MEITCYEMPSKLDLVRYIYIYIYIRSRKFNNLRFPDDIDLIAGSESKLQTITDALEKHRQHTAWKLITINAKFLSMEKVQHQ